MSSSVFQIDYTSSKGPSQVSGLAMKMHSPKGYINLTVQGQASELDLEIKQIKEDLKQSYSDTRKCQTIHVKDLFDAFSAIGCTLDGSQQDKNAFLMEHDLQRDVQDVTEILYDDCGGAITVMAYFRDSKNYYRVETFREWPGYEP